MQIEGRAPGGERAEEDRSPSKALIVGSVLVVAFFVVTYAYNAVSFARNSVRGDQWVWVESVLIPYHRGDMSIFEAVTFEFEPLSHSHIPALALFLLSFEFLDLDLSPDRVIGFLSLGAILFIVFRHARGFLRLDAALVVAAVASSILFMSSAPTNFGWSLLQFQMLYVLIAIIYLRSFVSRYETQPVIHALIAVPAVLLLGDAIGVAAFLATLAYLGVMGLLRKVSRRSLLAYFGLFPLQLFVLTEVFRGERGHAAMSLRHFVDLVIHDPGRVLTGLYYSAGSVFVALRPSELAGPFLNWAQAPVWVALTVVLGVLAVVLVWRTPLEAHERLPVLIVLAGSIWTIGVLRSRLFPFGAEVMQSPRYAPYTTLIGIGLTLLLASKVRFRPSLRQPLMVVAVVVVLANGLGSLKVTDNQTWVDEQKGELTSLRAYVRDETQQLDVVGGRCSRASCLRAAWFLYDMKLAAFRGDDSPRVAWESQLRNLLFDRFDEMAPSDRFAVCLVVRSSDGNFPVAGALDDPPFELEHTIARSGLELPEGSGTQRARLEVRVLRELCDRHS